MAKEKGNIYKVTIATGKSFEAKREQRRLVRAASKSQARAFAADDHIAVELASADDLIDLTKDGIEVEDAVAQGGN